MTTTNDDQQPARHVDLLEELGRGLGLIKDDDRKD